MPDDVVLNKVASLERCIQRIRQVYSLNDQNLYRKSDGSGIHLPQPPTDL